MMEEKIKEIVSGFIRVPAAQIGEATPIGRGAVQSSILLHRMYARLGEEGVVVENYTAITVFGDLMQTQGAAQGAAAGLAGAQGVLSRRDTESAAARGIGIDIEEVAALPRAVDFRKESFYSQNFTGGEIGYCILQPDPYSSFAGLFAVKEAIVKADAQYRDRPFSSLEIGHSADGKPGFPGFGLSISHAGGMAVAVAVSSGIEDRPAFAAVPLLNNVQAGRKPGFSTWIGWMALLLAAAALLVALKH
jgi:phosphopantetheine--protein transferase-like protein